MRPESSTVHVVIADDHPLVRSGIRSLLSTIPGVVVLEELGSGTELLELLDAIRPDVVITDVTMPGMDGLEALRVIRSRHPSVRVIVLSMHDEPEIVKRAIRFGAAAYLRKDVSGFELAAALQTVMITGSYVNAGIARVLMEPRQPSVQELLTARQIQILTMLASGQSSKQVGFALGLSPKTVDVHRARIMEKLGLRDLPSLTMYAVRTGLIKT
jgi:DNA-binding NarL/FixJ family response regulator